MRILASKVDESADFYAQIKLSRKAIKINKGNFHKCVNGHVFAIDECEEAICILC